MYSFQIKFYYDFYLLSSKKLIIFIKRGKKTSCTISHLNNAQNFIKNYVIKTILDDLFLIPYGWLFEYAWYVRIIHLKTSLKKHNNYYII